MAKLRSLPVDDKLRLRGIVQSIKDVLSRYWSGQDSYKQLVKRLDATAQLLLEDGSRADYGTHARACAVSGPPAPTPHVQYVCVLYASSYVIFHVYLYWTKNDFVIEPFRLAKHVYMVCQICNSGL